MIPLMFPQLLYAQDDAQQKFLQTTPNQNCDSVGLSRNQDTEMPKYTNDFISRGGFNKPLPGMTRATDLPGNQYYGNDGYIYNMLDGSRIRGNPPQKADCSPDSTQDE
jgi:hypothetical protein